MNLKCDMKQEKKNLNCLHLFINLDSYSLQSSPIAGRILHCKKSINLAGTLKNRSHR